LDPRLVKPIASRYNDSATRPTHAGYTKQKLSQKTGKSKHAKDFSKRIIKL